MTHQGFCPRKGIEAGFIARYTKRSAGQLAESSKRINY
jgi:hypothetical protein